MGSYTVVGVTEKPGHNPGSSLSEQVPGKLLSDALKPHQSSFRFRPSIAFSFKIGATLVHRLPPLQDTASDLEMSAISKVVVSLPSLVFCLFFLRSPLAVTCNSVRLRGLQPIAEPPVLSSETQQQAAEEYAEWIERVRVRYELKQKLVGDAQPGMVQPDLSVDFPGMKQYEDWESVVAASTYIVVDQNGRGNFLTVNDAVNSIPSDRFRQYRATIQVNAGVYREKVFIERTRPFITLQGFGQPTIVWNDTNFLSGNHTFDSATFGVAGNFFLARNITFQNTAPAPPPGAIGMQAVALRVTSDYAAFHDCTIIGNQDSLYDHNGRHYYKDCFIQGSIDFIFGNGLSMFYNCELKVISTEWGAVTAQKRQNASDNTGFSFRSCRITGAGQVYLGRAWGPFSRVVYSFTWMSDVIYAPGWFDWGLADRQLSVYYGQYRCSGPGSNEAGRVMWSRELTDWEAAPFLSLSFVDGDAWIPQSIRPL